MRTSALLFFCLLSLSFLALLTFNIANGATGGSSLKPNVTIIFYVGEINESNWGFGISSTSLTSPGPALSFHVGDVVNVTLINVDPLRPHSWTITDEPASNATVLFNAQIGSSQDPLPPGTSGFVLFTPTQAGAFYYLCTVPGHAENGEIGPVIIQQTLLTFAVYIRSDGSVYPSTAPIQQNGEIYTLNGKVSTNQDGIRIEKDNIILDGAGYTVQGVRTGTGVDLTDRNNVTVANVTVTQFFNGILLSNASGNCVLDNHVVANENVGIALFSSSSNNEIVENDVENNTGRAGVGIAVEDSSNSNTISRNNVTNSDSGISPLYDCAGNVVSENNVTSNSYGISLLSAHNNGLLRNLLTNNSNSFSLRSSSNNILRNNSITGDGFHFAVEGVSLPDFLNDIDASNKVEGKPVYYWTNTHEATIPSDAGYVALVNCSGITIKNLNLTFAEEQSILLAYTANSTVTSNHISANASGLQDYGVQLIYSNNNTLKENTITYRTYAIRLQNYCTGNVVTMNNITSNGQGIDMDEDSTSNTVSDNNVTDSGNGILLEYDSNNNIITENNITRTSVYAIRLSFTSDNNLITRNNVANNSGAVGLEYSSSGNRFYDNNFIDNAKQVIFYEGNHANFWDNGSQGNYWSDYTTRYPSSKSNDDTWDAPYVIDENNTDHYPLIARALSPKVRSFISGNLLWLIAIPAVVVVIALVAALPILLNMLGLNHRFHGRRFNLSGKRALIIATNHGTLGESGKETGVYASEMTVAYYEFLGGKMHVDVASIQGGEIPIEPSSLRWPVRTPADKRFLSDSKFQDKVKHSLKIAEVDFTQYDIVYMAGGWGAAYDLGYSEVLGQKISDAYADNVVLGSVCHGALGFLQAKDQNGDPLVKGRRITAVTDKQVKELRIAITPQHPERELRKAGALYESKKAFRDFFASHVVVDGNLVTGQNQNDAAETAQLMMGIVERKSTK